MNPKHLHILRHALGIGEDGRGKTWRNHFCTGPGGSDFEACQLLTTSGHMTDHGPRESMGGMHLFTVTVIGAVEATDFSPPPKVSRGKRIYRYWREIISDVSPDTTFKDFLVRPEFADSRREALSL